ncbi:nucleotidyltransferase [Actinoplanes sp. DH11]|uniref:nucleotidyltransferase domain-containing protein n=1 Tax=Actinoplanes sp. DH11 TaxID=2857011 RepID=UPI001E2D8302|nr:nucleotidyltransferase [Actinoplanes sp. DH11]
MATLATHFKTALSNIEPSDDAENAQAAHAEVTKVLEADDLLVKLGVDPILIGSYGRQVSIRRVKDVDVFVRLSKAGKDLRPGRILDHVAAVLEESFPGRVTRQHRSVMIDFPDDDLSVDVVIARPCGDHWEIPQKIEDDGNARWVETNPTKMAELTTQANKDYLLYDGDPGSGVYVPMVKLIRQIRRTWVDDQPGGYFFEVLAYHAFSNLEPNETSYAKYLTVVLREIADLLIDVADEGLDDPTLDGKTIKTKATPEQLAAAAARIDEAATLAEAALGANDCLAAVKWRELLGTTKNTTTEEQVFPLPEYCNADGTKKKTTAVTQGASTVPAGSGRYA